MAWYVTIVAVYGLGVMGYAMHVSRGFRKRALILSQIVTRCHECGDPKCVRPLVEWAAQRAIQGIDGPVVTSSGMPGVITITAWTCK